MKHVFGPVPSRRLGRSLGIDVVPFKTCTYDCIYCQLGRTTCKTVKRQQWLRWEPLLEELKRSLDSRPDYITFGGSGEPTLDAGLGELICRVKAITTIPVAVLTNGSLLWRPDVRRDLSGADLVIPSLDAGDELRFRCVNRPHETLHFEQVLEGLIAFRDEYNGRYWLEVLVVAPWTAAPEQVRGIAVCAGRIRPDRVQLNTVVRPPTEACARKVSGERLAHLATLFRPRAEVLGDRSLPRIKGEVASDASRILEMLRRRPSRLEDLTAAFGLHRREVLKSLDALARDGLLESVVVESELYYRAPPAESVRRSDASSTEEAG